MSQSGIVARTNNAEKANSATSGWGLAMYAAGAVSFASEITCAVKDTSVSLAFASQSSSSEPRGRFAVKLKTANVDFAVRNRLQVRKSVGKF